MQELVTKLVANQNNVQKLMVYTDALVLMLVAKQYQLLQEDGYLGIIISNEICAMLEIAGIAELSISSNGKNATIVMK